MHSQFKPGILPQIKIFTPQHISSSRLLNLDINSTVRPKAFISPCRWLALHLSGMDELNHCMMGQLSYHAYLLMVFKATSPL
jgi:hypothetical protein